MIVKQITKRYISSNKAASSFIPTCSYPNADLQKINICKDNKDKTGIYRWTHLVSGKSYIGSSVNLKRRFLDYYNISYLERETIKNNSLIYKALLKYGYSSFKLDILEYCEPKLVIEREQYYFNLFKPEYNILKIAGSISGFKHSIVTIKKMREAKLGRKLSELHRLKSIAANTQAQRVIVTNNKTGESLEFFSIRSVAKFLGIYPGYVARVLRTNKPYIKNFYTIVKK